MQGCRNPVVIVCRFQSLAGRGMNPFERFPNVVEHGWCWPCFAGWTDRLRQLARDGIGLGDGIDTEVRALLRTPDSQS